MLQLSIITINLNNSNGLYNTIKSVVEQTYKNYELIVIDGGSTDNSKDIIEQFSEQISFWVSEKDTGIYNAMNNGIRKAKGEYCLFLNSGDWLFNSNVLEDCINTGFKEDFVYGHQLIEQDGKFIEDFCLDVQYITLGSLIKSHIPHQCTFIKRDLFYKIGFYNEENKIVSDWEFIILCVCKHNCSIRRINVFMTVYNKNGISNNNIFAEFQLEERKKAMYKHFPLIIPDYEYFEALKNKKCIKFTLVIVAFLRKLKGFFWDN